MNLDKLRSVARGATAIRLRARVQPAGGPGDVVYPPTYSEGSTRHERRIDGESLPCVLLDSVASQANRIELALRDNDDRLPRLLVEVDGHRITSYDAPHRLCDAIFRGCTLQGQPYLTSAIGEALLAGDLLDLLGYSPASLLFGFWHSNRVGGVGIRVPRSISCELVAVNAAYSPHIESRIDPLPISNTTKVKRIKKPEDIAKDGWDWRLGGTGKPSDALLGNIPPTAKDDRGVTMDYATHSCVISLASIRSLGLGKHTAAATDLLAAMAMAGFTLAFGDGFNLRSRADFVPESPYNWEVVRGAHVDDLGTVTPEAALGLLEEACVAYSESGAPWHGETLLEPSEDLTTLVKEGWLKQGAA